jgi:hypothetical protein
MKASDETQKKKTEYLEYLDLLVLLDLLLSTTRVHGSQDLFQQLEHIDLLLSTTSLCFKCRAGRGRERESEREREREV